MTIQEQFDELFKALDKQEDLIITAAENALILDDGSGVDSDAEDTFNDLRRELEILRSKFEESNLLFDSIPTPEEQSERMEQQ